MYIAFKPLLTSLPMWEKSVQCSDVIDEIKINGFDEFMCKRQPT